MIIIFLGLHILPQKQLSDITVYNFTDISKLIKNIQNYHYKIDYNYHDIYKFKFGVIYLSSQKSR